MQRVPLKDYCDKSTQSAAGEVMGCSQSAVHQALKAGREIYIVLNDVGAAVDWFEVKRPRKPAA